MACALAPNRVVTIGAVGFHTPDHAIIVGTAWLLRPDRVVAGGERVGVKEAVRGDAERDSSTGSE